MSQLQISLAGMFGLTAAVAGSVVLFQNLGVYWLLIIGSVIACFRAPAWPGTNPILLGVAYMGTVLVFTCTLSYCMDVSAYQALVPCFILPALAYIVGFLKGMENA